jgi:hypothetical protein
MNTKGGSAEPASMTEEESRALNLLKTRVNAEEKRNADMMESVVQVRKGLNLGVRP